MVTMDRSLGSLPVSADIPCGIDVRYDETFQILQQEIDKLSSPVGRSSFAWETVAEKAALILKDHSKDLLAACYLAVALIHLNGAAGLETGAWIIRDLIVTHWTGLFPAMKRRKGRQAAMEWYSEKMAGAVADGAVWGFDIACREAVLDHLRVMDGFFAEQAEEISLASLVRLVESVQTVDSPDPVIKVQEPVPVKPSPPRHATVQTPAPSLSAMPTGSEDPFAGLAPLFQALKIASKTMLDEAFDNPQSYRWLRFAIWESLKGLPASKDRITRIPAPLPQLAARLETLHGSGDWPELLRASEAALHSAKHLFYLDLNRFSHEALSNLGPRYENAGRCVLSETRHLVRRLPSIETLLFEDKTPFASERTLEWLHAESHMPCQEGNGNPDPGVTGLNPDDMASVRAEIRNGMKINEAVSLYLQRIHTSTSGQEAFLWRLDLISLLASAKREKLASAQIDLVLDAIERHALGVWAPGFAAQGLKAVYKILKAHPDARRKTKPDDVFALLAAVDPLGAMAL